jgi:Mg2+-importing ATPase
MLAISSLAEYHGKVIPLTDEIRQEVTARANQLNDQGLRVIAVAQKNHVHDVDIFGVADENNMVLMGFIGFLDPPKESSKAAISTLQEHGVRVIVLTGDNDRVARKICSDVGLNVDEIIIGDQVEQMSDASLAECANRVAVFAKLSPLQKARVVRALQAQGHTVGFMGDGINDAPAMHQADIGISVDTAVDIAKETADIILLEKSLLVLGEGVIEGRRTFGNIVKYVNMAASSNFGNMFSVLAASLFLPFLPMLPLHILVQNLLYDFSQFTIPSDNMDEDFLSEPQKWDPENMQRFMLIIGPISSIFDIVTYLVMWFVFAANTPAMAAVFQTGWFIEGLISQTLIVHLIRTRKVPFIESRASRPLLLSTVLVIILGTALPWTAAGAALGLVQLPVNYFAWLLGILLAYGALTQFAKNHYIHRYGQWL